MLESVMPAMLTRLLAQCSFYQHELCVAAVLSSVPFQTLQLQRAACTAELCSRPMQLSTCTGPKPVNYISFQAQGRTGLSL